MYEYIIRTVQYTYVQRTLKKLQSNVLYTFLLYLFLSKVMITYEYLISVRV